MLPDGFRPRASTVARRFPRHDLTICEQLEDRSGWPVDREALESIEPEIDACRDGQILRNARDENCCRADALDFKKLDVLRKEDDGFLLDALQEHLIRESSLAKGDDMVNVFAGSSQSMIQREREVLVEEKLHDAFWIAGGT